MAVEHVITRSVRDSAAMLDAVSTPEEGRTCVPKTPAGRFREAAGRDPGRLRVAWATRPFLGSCVGREAVEGVEESVKLLSDLGHDCEEVAPPFNGAAFARSFMIVLAAETATDLREIGNTTGRRIRSGLIEAQTHALALAGEALPAATLASSLRVLDEEARRLARFLSPFDVLVTPTLAFPPVRLGALRPSGLERYALSLLRRMRSGRLIVRLRIVDRAAADAFEFVPWTPVFNVMGWPAMSVPLHWTKENLPMGTHVAGRFGEEATLLSLAGQLERARPWAQRRPAFPVPDSH